MRRRVSRPNLLTNRPLRSLGLTQKHTIKTQSAVCLLCLFDGLRSQSIRRLVRRPFTVCSKPFLIFDPSFYSPSSQRAISDLYLSSINCPCEVSVDPSVSTVTSLLRKHSSTIPPQRIIIHIMGQGTHIPSSEGDFYFFTDSRERYKAMKISNILSICTCPVTFIFDCSNAAALKIHLLNRKDVFAFFATAISENLQISSDAPLDLFTSCLFRHFETAFWWHYQRHRSIFDENAAPSEKPAKILKEFLEAVLDAILFDTQTPEIYSLLSSDKAVSHLFLGFALAQRVMFSFNVHPESLPVINPVYSHSLWSIWDVALDIFLTSPEDEAIYKIFNLFIESFEFFPITGFLPLFHAFLTIPFMHELASDKLFDFADSSEKAIEEVSRSIIPKVIFEIENPSASSLLLMAKSIAFNQKTTIEAESPLYFKESTDAKILSSGIICICCIISVEYNQLYFKLAQLCIDNAEKCAPSSSMLIGLLIANVGSLSNLPSYEPAFIPLLKSEREDIRAATIYALSFSRLKTTIDPIFEMRKDSSPIVRIQVMYAMISFYKNNPDPKFLDALLEIGKDNDQTVQSIFELLKEKIALLKKDHKSSLLIPNPILPHFLASIKEPGFGNRFNSNIFDIPIPIPQPQESTETTKSRIGMSQFSRISKI